MKNKTCLVIVGPTAVGKTSIAVELAQHYGTEIISADSRQCYKELNIGVAKPSPEQLQKVRHWFINSHSILEEVNAKAFEGYALQKVNEIFSKRDVAVMVGGTGLYIKAFCEGLDDLPEINSDIRKAILAKYEAEGMEWLQEEVKQTDPEFFARGEMKNPQRMMRALEVKLSAGRSIRDFHSGTKKEREFNIITLGLELPKAQLHQHINSRVDAMMTNGLLGEVQHLAGARHLNALQTVGYKELFEYFDGKVSLDTAIEQIKINTRHYSKRQLTWFKRDKSITWFDPLAGLQPMLEIIQRSLPG